MSGCTAPADPLSFDVGGFDVFFTALTTPLGDLDVIDGDLELDPSGFLVLFGALEIFGALDTGALDGAFVLECLGRLLMVGRPVISIVGTAPITNVSKKLH